VAKMRNMVARVSPGRLFRPLFIVFVVFYFSYHLAHGERGLFALVREQQQLAKLHQEIDTTRQARKAKEQQVAHLRDDALDLDLLDEQMRRLLGMMKSGELVVIMGPSAASASDK
jgi:cell division protein FtsB